MRSMAKTDDAIPSPAKDALKVYGPATNRWSSRAKHAIRSISICRSGRIIIGDDGKVKSIAFKQRLESMRLIGGIHGARQRRGSGVARKGAHAADLSRT